MMTETNLETSPEKDESSSTIKEKMDSSKESKVESKGILSYSSKETQSVISLFGFELTAPSGLKNPGIVYLAFIIVNLFIFLALRNFISG